VKLPRIVFGCASQRNVYVPTWSVSFHVRLPAKAMPVFLLTPGPSRWKLWDELWSEMTNLCDPGLACVTLAPLAFLSVIVGEPQLCRRTRVRPWPPEP